MYRRLRQLVLERARFCCEYCQMPQVFSDGGHELDHTIAISAGTPMAAPAGETGAWRGRSGRLTSSCPNTPWRPSLPSRCRIAQDFKKVRHGEPGGLKSTFTRRARFVFDFKTDAAARSRATFCSSVFTLVSHSRRKFASSICCLSGELAMLCTQSRMSSSSASEGQYGFPSVSGLRG